MSDEKFCFNLITILRETTKRLDLSDLTMASACTFYHRVIAECGVDEVDPYTIAMACVNLAAKCQEEDVKLRDIINCFFRSVHPLLPPLEVGSEYDRLRESLINCELFVMRMLKFQVYSPALPHPYLVHYLDSLDRWITPSVMRNARVSCTAWAVLSDSYHSDICLHFKPQEIAVSVLHLSLRVVGVEVPGNRFSTNAWWQAVYEDISRETVEAIQLKLMKIYSIDDRLDRRHPPVLPI